MDALAGALGDVAPAAGPDRRLTGRGSRRNGSGIQSGQKSGARQSPAFSRKAAGGAAAPGRVGSALNRSSFAATRGRTSFSSGTPAIAPSDGDFGAQPSLFATQTDIPFDQQVELVNDSGKRVTVDPTVWGGEGENYVGVLAHRWNLAVDQWRGRESPDRHPPVSDYPILLVEIGFP